MEPQNGTLTEPQAEALVEPEGAFSDLSDLLRDPQPQSQAAAPGEGITSPSTSSRVGVTVEVLTTVSHKTLKAELDQVEAREVYNQDPIISEPATPRPHILAAATMESQRPSDTPKTPSIPSTSPWRWASASC